MPTFLDLPVEIHLQIIAEIHLNDIEEFSLSCKTIHEYSEKRLMEQYARRRHLSTIAVGHIDNKTFDEDPQIRGVHPLLALQDILADPKNRLYTKTLIVGSLNKNIRGTFDDEEEAELDSSDIQQGAAQCKREAQLLMKPFHSLLSSYFRNFRFDHPRKIEEWTNNILSGSMNAGASLLIAILPNLQKLRIVNTHWPTESHSIFLTTVDALLRTAVSNNYDLTGINAFSQLTELGMIGVSKLIGAKWTVMEGFMMLPSLRTIKARAMAGNTHEQLEGNIDLKNISRDLSKSAKVTSLEFRQSVILAEPLRKTLSRIEGLQSFAYDYWTGAFWTSHIKAWQPRQIVEALKDHTKKTLRNLELTSLVPTKFTTTGVLPYIDFAKGEPFIGNLCHFEVLETIRVETMMLYKEVDVPYDQTPKGKSTRASEELVERERLVDTLPKSTRRLRLVGGLSNEDAAAMLEDLPALKGEKLPNLSRIFFEDVERSELDADMVRECEDAGVKMKFWRPVA